MIKILIGGVNFPIQEYSLSIKETLNERATASFGIVTDLKKVIIKAQPVQIYNGDELIFNGFINSPTKKDYLKQNTRFYTCDCADLTYLVDKRLYVRGFIETDAGMIVKTMVDEVLNDEGITYTTESIEAGAFITAISFSYKSCADIMQELSEISGFIWYVDYNGIIHFKSPTSAKNAVKVKDGMIINDTLKIENKNNSYRNKQYLKGATAQTPLINQSFISDGSNQSFTLGYRLSEKPKIYVNNEYIAEDDIVIKGYNETAKWFYEKHDAVIAQNPQNEAVPFGQEIRIEYIGEFPIIAITESYGEVERLKGLGAGSGIVENLVNESEINTMQTAIQSAVGKIQKYGKDTFVVTFKTQQTIYDVGQVIDFDLIDFKDDNYLITDIEIIDDLNFVWYNITCAKGALNDSWEMILGKGLRMPPTVLNQEISETETVILQKNFSKTWQFEEKPNIFKIIYPNGQFTPNGNITPTFNAEERISYVEIYDNENNLMIRNIKSVQSDATKDNILTYFFIDTYDAIGTWAKIVFYGGMNASFIEKSGVIVDEIALNLKKTEIEGVQLARTDIKGW